MNRQSSILNHQWTRAAVAVLCAALLPGALLALGQAPVAARKPATVPYRPRRRRVSQLGSPAAQPDFLRGVAWLHSFGYEDAIDAFREAQKIDPDFAMAYWGEAMSFNQPLWFHEEVEQGRAVLRKLGPTPAARQAKAKTPREQGYVAR